MKFADFWNTVLQETRESLDQMAVLLPDLGIALTVLFLGWLLGIALEAGFLRLAKRLHLEKLWKKLGFDTLLQQSGIKRSPSAVVATFIKGVIITFFLKTAAKIMQFVEVEDFLDKVIALIPDIIIALLILLFAIKFAETMGALTENLLRIADKKARAILASVAKNIIIAFGIMAALVQIKIAPDIITILFTGFIAMLALAGGLAFGLGGKDFIRELLEDIRKK